MLLRYRARTAARLLRSPLARLLLVIFALFNTIQVWRVHRTLSSEPLRSSSPPSSSSSSSSSTTLTTTSPRSTTVSATTSPQKNIPHHSRRVYVAGIHWNNAPVLRSHWNDAVVALADALGPENIYVSVHESGSWDESKDALAELDAALAARGVARTVSTSNVTHRDEILKGLHHDDNDDSDNDHDHDGWIRTPRGRLELRRIPYLSKLRNESIRKLAELSADGVEFDRVLFLNDVVFSVDDVLELMDTNDGKYAAACSLDYKRPPAFYDTFALRDDDGHEAIMQTWPYFRSRASRHALVSNVPVPVASCWNGIVSMPASPFLVDPPVRFRGIPDSLAAHHLEGSECCLVHADNPLTPDLGVWLNPRVRVGYDATAYDAAHASRPGRAWVSHWGIARGLWANRVLRWMQLLPADRWGVLKKMERWRKEGKALGETRVENGGFCLVDEMQVLVENGWAHV